MTGAGPRAPGEHPPGESSKAGGRSVRLSPPVIPGPPSGKLPFNLKRLLPLMLVSLTATLILVGVIGPIAWSSRVRGAWSEVDQEIAAIRARGEPVEPAELNPPPVPDEENAAIALGQAEMLIVPRANRRLWEGMDTDASSAWPATSVQRLREWVGENAEALRLAREAATRPKCRFPVDYTQGMALRPTHHRWVRTGAWLLRASASVNIADKRWDAAARDVADTLALGRHLDREPMLMGKVAQFAVYGLAMKPTRALLREPDLPPSAIATLQSALDGSSDPSNLQKAVAGERAIALSVFQRMREENLVPRDVGQAGVGERYPAWLLVWDELFYLRQVGRLETLSGEPPYSSAQALAEWEAETQTKAQMYPPKILSALFIPVFSHAQDRYTHCLAGMATARVAVAVRQHHLRTGKLPATLAELVPSELAEVPSDPFTGKSLRCRAEPQAGKLVVYSLGANMADDGGVETSDWEKGDIVVEGRVRRAP